MVKRGVSEVITTVLIIALVVAVIGVLWAFLFPVIKGNLQIDCSSVDVGISSNSGYTCFSNDGVSMVQIYKGSAEANISSLKFNVLSNGESVSFQKDVFLLPLSQKIFYLDSRGIGDINEIRVASVLKNGNVEKVCGEVVLKNPPKCDVFDVSEEEIIPQNSRVFLDGTSSIDKHWYFDADCDGYGNGTSVVHWRRPSFEGCINTTDEVSTINQVDVNDNDKYCYGEEICNLRSNLVAYWPMDEIVDGKMVDYSGLNHHGTAYNVTMDSAILGEGFRFKKEENTSVVVDYNISANYLSFTWAGWIKAINNTQMGTMYANNIYAHQSGNGYEHSWRIFNSQNLTDSKVKFGIGWGNGTNASKVLMSDICDLNRWYFILASYDGKIMSLYLNGVLNSTFDCSTDLSKCMNYFGGSPRYIGRQYAGINWFNGTMDEVAIFNRSLSAEEIYQLYNSGSGLKLIEN